jgi:hypothetical protein
LPGRGHDSGPFSDLLDHILLHHIAGSSLDTIRIDWLPGVQAKSSKTGSALTHQPVPIIVHIGSEADDVTDNGERVRVTAEQAID